MENETRSTQERAEFFSEDSGTDHEQLGIRVHTHIGDLIAYTCPDPLNPGISIVMAPKGSNDEIDIAFAEVPENPKWNIEDAVKLYEWANPLSEDYTSMSVIRFNGAKNENESECFNKADTNETENSELKEQENQEYRNEQENNDMHIKRFQVFEDNSGGLTLFVFDRDGNVEYAHDGYEYEKGQLIGDLKEIRKGADPKMEWEGDFQDENNLEVSNQQLYEQMVRGTGANVICDNNGLYIEKMGDAGKQEFNVKEN